MLAFDGTTMPPELRRRLAAAPAAGVTLFRALNVRDPGQVRELTDALRAIEPGLLVAADQEGGQLIALGDGSTQFAGNMALGAAGDADLAERVGRATALELRAMGVSVDYAPSCDVVTPLAGEATGIRSFGDDPAAAASLAAATVRGIQSAGVAATAKHFPGLGGAPRDSHKGLVVSDGDREQFERRELVPFRAAIDAGVGLVMSGHVATPGLTGKPALPATLSRAVMHDLLRGDLGFDGLVISDALDMAAIPQGDGQVSAVIAALGAGVDLLLTAPDTGARARIEAGLREAAGGGLLDPGDLRRSAGRLDQLRAWLASFDDLVPDPSLVGGAEHRVLTRELAERSVTLVRDDDGLLPLRLEPGQRVLAVMPQPRDLTPADTSSYVAAGLARAIRGQHPDVDEIVTGHPPNDAAIAAARERASSCALVIVGTLAASVDPKQAELVEALRGTGVSLVTVALRTPYDLASYPLVRVHACSYGILEPSLDALAAALFGRAPFRGHLPAAIPGIAPTGHGLAGPLG